MHQHIGESMLSVEEARERVLGLVHVLESELRPIQNALGQVLSESIISEMALPPLDNSAMDGYAVQAKDTLQATKSSPVILRVCGTLAAGQIPEHYMSTGSAVRIMTGAPIPPGADAIVPFEETDEQKRKIDSKSVDSIGVFAPTTPGSHVRPARQDVAPGDQVLRCGVKLRPSEIGIMASIGINQVPVIRRPVVSIIATGNELSEPGTCLTRGNIYDSNSYGLAAEVTRAGGIPHTLGIARDDVEEIRSKIDQAMSSDLLITSAGVSKGDYDVVKDVLAYMGKIEFWSVRMRPAKPFAFGFIETPDGKKLPHLGLPGNPVSSMVAFSQFGRAAIRKMMGLPDLGIPTVEAILEDNIENFDGRRVYARVTITKRDGSYYARSTGEQGSNILTSMVHANGLAVCPEHTNQKRSGEVVVVQMLDWSEDVFR